MKLDLLILQTDVLALVDAFEDLGNPFMEDSGDLDESVVMPPDVVHSVREVKNIGMKRYTVFVDKRVRSQEEAFTAPIPLTRLKLFKAPFSQRCNKSEVAVVKDQQAKVTQLLLAVHSGCKIDERVFSHESSPHPPSLTRKGKMHHGNKSEILDCIVPRDLDNHRPVTTAAVLDGDVLVQMLRPGSAVTIGQYFTDVFAPYILSWFERNDCVDIVWDVCSKTSLKSGIREQRGTDARRRVALSAKVPGNWASFLRVDLNKKELFMELAKSLTLRTLPQGRELFTTMLEDCLSSPASTDTDALAPCTHKEADTRIFIYVAAAAVAGHRRVIVRSSDSDVVVLAIATFVALGQKIDELWIAFGVRRHFRYRSFHSFSSDFIRPINNHFSFTRYIPAHAIAHSLGPSKAMALPAFHALTGYFFFFF
ncbi:uncharacterized protein LOC127531687 [Acanthochromis polyacanthus]|uniref:uncharacterized protein LOC127531687 n=1 Tax=Acanthochromis polyacanthus TaxID=80966 RepID=UPI0022344DD5|nr:uncharacterized protein LOC127531687 [Acanthochromis polyacanthus]